MVPAAASAAAYGLGVLILQLLLASSLLPVEGSDKLIVCLCMCPAQQAQAMQLLIQYLISIYIAVALT
jgi:hypothetical protein